MKKFLVLALSVALAALFWRAAATPAAKIKTYNLGDVVAAVEKANPVSNPATSTTTI